MKMEILAVQQLYHPSDFAGLGSNKVKDWTSPLTPPPEASTQATTNLPYNQTNTINKMKSSINNQKNRRLSESQNKRNTPAVVATNQKPLASNTNKAIHNSSSSSSKTHNNVYYSEDFDATAINDLSLRLLDELRAAKSRHLSCTEVSLPCDLTPRIAAEILRLSEREPCGLRGCTVYIEFEDEPNNSRRIASLKLDKETVSTFEIYLTLRQDHRGWAALLPQFMKGLSRTITISPEFNITKNKLYSPLTSSGYMYTSSKAISTPTA
ncbi:protein scylla [Stomoxys calcitrans]|uniref:Protein scylla n=1 Tax=Stomoxys calcitrans TaxID=35570 RepID=A0A1I8Q8S0_STOCA|nr:protein scylla [Stomoxys calcitrans]